MNNVYEINRKIKSLKDKRKRHGIKISTAVEILMVGMILQKPSIHSILESISFRKIMNHMFRLEVKIPKKDAAREIYEQIETKELLGIHDETIKKIRENKTFRKGTIDGLVVSAIDGVELFTSENKCCKDCLTRETNGIKEYFHKSVVCMTVGADPHIILGEEMLFPRDGSKKDEGEATGAKRLIDRLYKTHHHFADVIVADALYLNAPFINKVLSKNMEVVIRAKNAAQVILQDAIGLTKITPAQEGFEENRVKVSVWDIPGFEMAGVQPKLRFLQFKEVRQTKTGQEERTVWVFTTLNASAKTIWRIMHSRWEIENNGFHQLKTYYHADHCFVHRATENILLINILAFNLREMYLFRRLKDFRETKITRVDMTQMWLMDLYSNNYSEYFDTG